MLSSGPGGAVHSAVSHVLKWQPINIADSNYRKSEACANILFILVLKEILIGQKMFLHRVKI